jgi:hypothetical protein
LSEQRPDADVEFSAFDQERLFDVLLDHERTVVQLEFLLARFLWRLFLSWFLVVALLVFLHKADRVLQALDWIGIGMSFLFVFFRRALFVPLFFLFYRFWLLCTLGELFSLQLVQK